MYKLHQNVPNPFNSSTQIFYEIPKAVNVKLNVFDIQGKEVKTLVNKKLTPGIYQVDFDASSLSSGIYFLKIEAESYSDTKIMILVK